MRSPWLALAGAAGLGLSCVATATPPGEGPAPAPAAGLAGTAWLAEDLDGRGVMDRVEPTLAFEGDARVHGSTGCNRYAGPVQIRGSSLRFGALASTRRACPPPVMDQEARFLAALEAARGWRIEAGKLLLSDDAGTARLRLAPQEPRPPSDPAAER